MKLTREKIGNADIRIWSGGNGPPLLYLHGFEQHPGDAPFLNRLAESFEIRAPEAPGFGQSTGLDDMHDLLDMTLHNRALVEAWGRGPVNVIGHSLGGMFAAELAVIAPHLVRRMVLVSPYGLWLDDEPLPDPFVLAPDAMAKAKWHDPVNAAKEPSAYDEVSDGPRHTFRTINLSAATKFLWPLPDRGLARRAHHVRTPVSILRGANDGLVSSRYCEAFAKLLKGELVTLKGAGHLPMVEQEDAFMAAVRPFLKQQNE
jgi:pimeloyl-ACP methyl ester carboxylesterase